MIKYQDILLRDYNDNFPCVFPEGLSWDVNLQWSTELIDLFTDK